MAYIPDPNTDLSQGAAPGIPPLQLTGTPSTDFSRVPVTPNTPTPSQAQPMDAPKSGFAGILQKVLPAFQALTAGAAAAGHNYAPAEMVMQQREEAAKQSRQAMVDAQAEQERQMRMQELALDIQRKKEDFRVNPPRSTEDLMKANLSFQSQLAEIERTKKEPKTFTTEDGKLWYQGEPGQPSQPVMIQPPPQVPGNAGDVAPGASGPITPQERQQFTKTMAPEQAQETVKGRNLYEDLTSGDPMRMKAAQDFMDQTQGNKVALKAAPSGAQGPINDRADKKLQLEALKDKSAEIDKDMKDLEENANTTPGADNRAKMQQQLEGLRRQKTQLEQQMNELTGKVNPVSSTRTRDGQDVTKMKKGDPIWVGNKQYKFDHLDENGKIVTQ